jgi:hypothetical protein
MSRRAFYPTAEQRGKVEEIIGYGLSEAEICLLFKNPGTGKTIDLRTFRKCFKTEIDTGAAKLKSQVGQQIVATILGEPGGIPDPRARATLTVLFAKNRMGWKETVAGKHAKKDGRPFIFKVNNVDAKL